MEYFKLLQLDREPFSNSPDPGFFYESAQHKDCIQKLEIALRLRRGLNVVTGEVGTGKTTLCRQLIQAFSDDPAISACLLLDPDFPDPRTFLSVVVHTITGRKPINNHSIPAMKEHLKQYLFQKGVEEERTIVLIVDEGQKMPPDCLETLRELLNFETNEYKLFQVVIFAQNEFEGILNALPNLADRVNLYYRLGPLNFKDTRALIQRRIRLAGGSDTGSRLFSLPALWRIFRLSGGFPRKIVHLCHQCLLTMIIQNKTTVSSRMVGACARRVFVKPRQARLLPVGIALVLLMVLGLGTWRYSGGLQKPQAPAESAEDKQPRVLLPEAQARTESGMQSLEPEMVDTPSPGSIQVAVAIEADAPPPEARKLEADPGAATTRSLGEPPGVLGRVQVTLGDTLGGLVQKVYGAYTYRYHQAVLTANPDLVDPDSLIAGRTLVFPALSEAGETVPDTTWWITLSRETDLGAATAKLREEALEGLPLRILALGNPEGNFSFRVVLETCFENEDLAKQSKEQLAVSVPTNLEVFCLKKSDAVIYGSIGI